MEGKWVSKRLQVKEDNYIWLYNARSICNILHSVPLNNTTFPWTPYPYQTLMMTVVISVQSYDSNLFYLFSCVKKTRNQNQSWQIILVSHSFWGFDKKNNVYIHQFCKIYSDHMRACSTPILQTDEYMNYDLLVVKLAVLLYLWVPAVSILPPLDYMWPGEP